MGLDAYFKSYNGLELDKDGHVKGEYPDDDEELGYFRKVNWLHNWMQQQYAKDTGITAPHVFNCVHVKLTRERLLKLQSDILNNNISCTEGFFFGQQEIEDYQINYCMKVIAEALCAVSLGKIVTYHSWW